MSTGDLAKVKCIRSVCFVCLQQTAHRVLGAFLKKSVIIGSHILSTLVHVEAMYIFERRKDASMRCFNMDALIFC